MGDATVSSWLATEMSSNTSHNVDDASAATADAGSVSMNMNLWEKALLSAVLLVIIVGTIIGNILVMAANVQQIRLITYHTNR